jgi:hypothetical protein
VAALFSTFSSGHISERNGEQGNQSPGRIAFQSGCGSDLHARSSATLPLNRTVLLNKLQTVFHHHHHHHSHSVISSDERNAYAFPRRLDSAVTRSWFSRCRSAQAPLRLIPGQVSLAFPCVHSTRFRYASLAYSSLALPPNRAAAAGGEQVSVFGLVSSLRPRGSLLDLQSQSHSHTQLLTHTSHAYTPTTRSLTDSPTLSLSLPELFSIIYLRVPANLGYYAACPSTSSHSHLTPPTSVTVARVSRWRISDLPTPFGDLTTHDERLSGCLSLDGHDLSAAYRRTRTMAKPSMKKMTTMSKMHGVTRSWTSTPVNATHINLLHQWRPHRLPCLHPHPFGVYLYERTHYDHLQRLDERAGATRRLASR